MFGGMGLSELVRRLKDRDEQVNRNVCEFEGIACATVTAVGTFSIIFVPASGSYDGYNTDEDCVDSNSNEFCVNDAMTIVMLRTGCFRRRVAYVSGWVGPARVCVRDF